MKQFKELNYEDFSEARKAALEEIKSNPKKFMEFIWGKQCQNLLKKDIIRILNINDQTYTHIIRRMRNEHAK